MREIEETFILANKILDNASLDPDSDISMLSRQFLRALERERKLIGMIGDIRSIIAPLEEVFTHES
jgi:hypothetical protein